MSRPDDQGSSSESFAALFEAESKNKPRRAAGRGYSPGEVVEGTVVRVGKDAVFLDLDGKREGYIEITEVRDESSGEVTVAIGDIVRATVINAGDGDGAVRLGKSMPKGRGAEGLQAAKDAQLPVEGTVTGVNKGGLEVTVDNVRCFCPARAVDTRFVQDLNVWIGQKLKFLVTQVSGRDVVLSRRAFLEREADEARAKMGHKLVPGAVLEGVVTSTREFGAFIDLGGVEALLPASELSHDRSLRPADVVKPGETIRVQVLEVSQDDKRPGQQKITLSLKALAGDPWETTAKELTEGSIRDGRVVRVQPFGAFVQLAPGLDGLLHVSELTGEEGQTKLPQVGDMVSVRVIKVDLAQRRIALGPSDRQPRAVRAASTLVQGAVVKGKVSAVEKFGVFVQIEGGVGRGLIPAGELEKRGGDFSKQFPVGTEVQAKIVAIDAAGKIRLSLSAAKADEERATFEDYRAKENERARGGIGSLGAKLQQALKKK
ncbi:MAG: S1 RNA-binding domain-containing protein [Deltaproteobacteria bacterium]|nr:S1 RNA-binding domain-containing protein [Deltaproteobacteria bacterium]